MLRRVQVECYAGSRADEYPRRVIDGARAYTVARLLGSSIKEAAGSNDRSCHFTLLTEDGVILNVVKSSDDQWHLDSEPSRAEKKPGAP
ncbi:MAG TPA: hypothetical protein VJH03_12190 [Blastocatellia bacterium]|nr:hypothetical protein [Blastocatellia bacterium]